MSLVKRLATRLLRDLGITVAPNAIVLTMGQQRKMDCLRWEALAKIPNVGVRNLGSWDTLTDCLRADRTLKLTDADKSMSGFFEVHACMATLAVRAVAFARHPRGSPAEQHEMCNAYLRALRSGSRRRRYGKLRAQLRIVRERSAQRLLQSKGQGVL